MSCRVGRHLFYLFICGRTLNNRFGKVAAGTELRTVKVQCITGFTLSACIVVSNSQNRMNAARGCCYAGALIPMSEASDELLLLSNYAENKMQKNVYRCPADRPIIMCNLCVLVIPLHLNTTFTPFIFSPVLHFRRLYVDNVLATGRVVVALRLFQASRAFAFLFHSYFR